MARRLSPRGYTLYLVLWHGRGRICTPIVWHHTPCMLLTTTLYKDLITAMCLYSRRWAACVLSFKTSPTLWGLFCHSILQREKQIWGGQVTRPRSHSFAYIVFHGWNLREDPSSLADLGLAKEHPCWALKRQLQPFDGSPVGFTAGVGIAS